MRIILFILAFTLSSACFGQRSSGGVLQPRLKVYPHGNTQTLDSNLWSQFIAGTLRMPFYAIPHTVRYMGIDSNGMAVMLNGGGGSGGLSPTDSTYIIMNGGGGDSATFYTKYRSDTSRANIYGAIGNKLNLSAVDSVGGSPDNQHVPTTGLTNGWINDVYTYLFGNYITGVNSQALFFIRADSNTAKNPITLDYFNSHLPAGTDTTSLSNRINLKLNSVDTASLSNRINLKMNYSDTVGLSNRINLKLTATDTASLSNRINLKMGYADTVGLSNRINLKLNSSDTAGLSGRINLKLNSSDTAGLSGRINLKLNSADTAGLSGRINLKQNTGNYITALTGDVSATGPGSAAATLQTVNATPGTYGSGTVNQVLTVDSKGRITTITTVAISAGSGSATVVYVGDGLTLTGTASVNPTVAIAAVTTNTLTLTTHATTLTATTGHSQGFTTDNFAADTVTLAGFGATAAGGGGFTSTVMLTVLQNATGGSAIYFRGQTFSSALGTGAQPGCNTAANGLTIYYLRWNDYANRVTIDYTTY